LAEDLKMPAKKARSNKSRASSSKSKSKGQIRKKRAAKKSVEKLNPSARRFVRDLLIRGEAARPDSKGNLPSGATHVIVEENEDGTPIVKRERFSLY
jgi:hypothetical protein